jgi:uncharacterized protein YjbJ (UPF0337 family)
MAKNMDDLKGRAKQAIGDATDDKDMKREGAVDKATGAVKDKVEEGADKIKEHLPGDK